MLQGDLLLEVLDKERKQLQIPTGIHRLGARSFQGVQDILVEVWSADQVEDWMPLLKAQRAVLQIRDHVRLPLGQMMGLDPVFTEQGAIDFAFYDSRAMRLTDKKIQLDIAISRLLYPEKLSETAEQNYRKLVTGRYRPAMLRLVTGKWELYGKLPERVSVLIGLKRPDRFLRKELMQKAAEYGNVQYIQYLSESEKKEDTIIAEKTEEKEGTEENVKAEETEENVKAEETAENGIKEEEKTKETAKYWKSEEGNRKKVLQNAAAEIYSRKPELEGFCEVLTLSAAAFFKSDQEKRIPEMADANRMPRAFAHILFHGIFLHPFQNSPEYSDLSADIAVEYQVNKLFGPLWEKAEESLEKQKVFDRLLLAEPVLTAETVEKQLIGWKLSREKILQLRKLFQVDDHGTWPGRNGKSADSFRRTGLIGFSFPEGKEIWEGQVKKWLAGETGGNKFHGRRGGEFRSKAGDRREEAGLKKREGYDYHDFLRQFMVLKEDRLLDTDSFDPVYYTYGLNTYDHMPFIEPLETKEVMRLQELVIVIDTSGSCSGRLVRFFLEETWSVFGQSENFFDHFHVRVLQCDAIVQEDVKITSLREADEYMKHLVIRGGGGTDFREAFRYVKHLQKKGELRHLKGILYFTDGFGTFPETPPDCRSTFIFLKNRFSEVSVPYWADKLLLELPEDAGWQPEYSGAFTVSV
ncbi:MAG: VWA-like domain-containing protein [Lachnospiraceae bacterium]